MERDAPRCYEDAPKVEAGVAAEGVEDPDGELDCHPEGDGCEDCDEGPDGTRVSGWICRRDVRRKSESDLPNSLVPWERACPSKRPVEVIERDIRNCDVVASRHNELLLGIEINVK